MQAGFYTGFNTVAERQARSGRSLPSILTTALLALVGLSVGQSAHAVDGCKVLLCMAGNWSQIAACAPTVREALRDVLRGHPWPSCGMSGNSDTANQFVAPADCPEQYRVETLDFNDRPVLSCPFVGAVSVAVKGQPWSRTWWSMDGNAVVEWLPAAREAFASRPSAMDTRFDDDHAAWVIAEAARRAALPPVYQGP